MDPSFPGDDLGTIVALDAGDYAVTEDTNPLYTATFVGDCSGTLAVGEEKTCTIINNDGDVLGEEEGEVLPATGVGLTRLAFAASAMVIGILLRRKSNNRFVK